MPPSRDTYPVEIAGVKRDLTLFEIKPGLKIAVLNILGDTELVEAAASALAERLASIQYDLLVTAEAKSIPLIHALSVRTRKAYVVLRKSYKPTWARPSRPKRCRSPPARRRRCTWTRRIASW